ncbi:MAG: hypothetical protein KatS3mg065_1115 [Chloroflexota bacterium]|nr:MAG: hypothetical protein KatS3mg065_1115 [Chloroflexota bacterium]
MSAAREADRTGGPRAVADWPIPTRALAAAIGGVGAVAALTLVVAPFETAAFGGLTVPVVLAAGVADGLNPCAFALLVLFATYTLTLASQRRRRRDTDAGRPPPAPRRRVGLRRGGLGHAPAPPPGDRAGRVGADVEIGGARAGDRADPDEDPGRHARPARRMIALSDQPRPERRAEMKYVGVYEAKTRLPKLLDEVERGESITITRHGRPVARLVPLGERRLSVDEAIEAFVELRRSRSLGDLSLDELIESGRI